VINVSVPSTDAAPVTPHRRGIALDHLRAAWAGRGPADRFDMEIGMRAGYTEEEWKKLEHTQTAQANTLAEGGSSLPAVAQGKTRGDRVASYHPTWTLRTLPPP
jgi:hypothetical protein